ncbi:MAG: ABC transporter ATP-binding protein/permease [Sporichthyaceae bacterium]|nr:ABC transporter ATP-binding protein/permease [Sporichthyaceae bacterium]
MAQVSRTVLRRGLGILGLAIKEEPRIFLISTIGAAVYGIVTVVAAWVLGEIIDRVILPAFRDGRTTAGTLAVATAALLATSMLKAAGIVARRLGAGIMMSRLQATYRRKVTRQYLRLPLAWHHRHPTGELLSNANADVEATWYPIAPLPMAVGVLVMLMASVTAMVATDVVLAAVGLLVFPLVFVLNLFYQRRLSPIATRAQHLRGEVSEVAHESFDGALVVKALGREAEETERFRAVSDELRAANVAAGRIRGLFDPILEALPNLGILAVLAVGTARVSSGALQPGDVVQIAYLFTLVSFPIRAIGWVLGELPRSVVGYDRVERVLEAQGSLRYGQQPAPLDGGPASRLAVNAIRYGYLDDHDVLKDVSFMVSPGRTVAVVGPTGSGKSTLTSLLVRLVDPGTGEVLLDGVDLRDFAAGGVAATAAVVPQQAFLFDDTVRDNVTLGLDVPDDTVWKALALAQADGFVDRLPERLDTQVGERGTTLSGGQRQRLALARAVVRRPKLLVLDDATSSVDPAVEARILAGLRDSAATVVVVAYRRATIALADEVVYIEHGRVLDRGRPDELAKRLVGFRNLLTAYEKAAGELDRALAN